jgi:O-antigen/teichoic acid export membrane protein
VNAPKHQTAIAASSTYFLFQALKTVASFVSLPVITRALTKDEFGLLNLTLATVGMLAQVARLGFGEATIRFYFERSQQGLRHLREFCGTMLTGSFVAGSLFALGTVLSLNWITPQANTAQCLRLASLIIVIRVVLSVVYQIYRAQERVIAFSIAQIMARYASLAVAITFLLGWGSISAYDVVLATVIGEGCVALFGTGEFAVRGVVGRPTLSGSHLSAAFGYGTPLAVGTWATFLLDYGDRFLIQRYLGFDAVAIYAVPYDLVSALAVGVFGSLKLALLPIIFRLWETEGREATTALVSQVLTYSVALSLPCMTLLMLNQHEIIVLLSSAKYAASADLLTYLLPGVCVGELNFLVAAGLLVQRGTVAYAVLTFASAGLNVGLNVILLPRWGLVGAAWATTITFALMTLGTYLVSRRSLPLYVSPLVLGEAVLTTLLMILVVNLLGHVSSQPIVDLAVRGTAGVGVAGLCMSLLDREIRRRTWLRIGAAA